MKPKAVPYNDLSTESGTQGYKILFKYKNMLILYFFCNYFK